MSSLTDFCSCVLQLSTCDYAAPDPTYPPYDSSKWVAIAYSVCVFCVVSLGVYAMLRYTMWMMKRKRDESVEEFCTAKGSQGKWRIAYSFFASSVGAWCISAPASFAVYNGILGIAMYALGSGLPLMILAFCGARIVRRHPTVVSVGDFAGKRFGPTFKTIVMLITLFNMAIAMTAEYTTVGSLFSDFVGSTSWPAILTVGAVTMIYTMYGGLSISIITDQVQAIITLLFIAILTIYVAVTFRAPLPHPLPNDLNMDMDPETGYIYWPLGVNKYGYSSIFSMPVSLFAATVFSEAMWQKIWASEDRSTMIFGGVMGGSLVTIAVFLFGFGGLLAAWAGYVNFSTNPNLFLFQVFNSEIVTSGAPPAPSAPVFNTTDYLPPSPGGGYPTYPPLAPPVHYIYNGLSARLRSWVGVITLMLAVTMNESAIDSMQNGIASCISTHFFRNQHILWTRMIVVLINVPIMIVATQSFQILQLFLITNMLTTCWFIPVLCGLSDFTTDFVGETGVVFGGIVATLTTIAYSTGKYWHTAGAAGDALQCGSWYAWYGDVNYDWDQFMVACSFSVVGMLMWSVPAYILRRYFGIHGPGISGVLCRLPGFRFITGDGLDCDLLEVTGLSRFVKKPVSAKEDSPFNSEADLDLEMTKEKESTKLSEKAEKYAVAKE
ncbi:hypothetical protein CEUSTIGMA_g9371.t1 [Chlamydomonas eustigma]|uniref:Uncharacterized protein n=1 Tax=Chlamydomonas eustigma TaxID=1157962 RepID=A0A250XFV7_9CHLO|nr:hypothetical protein CEUSTIGMA_g9371.t1 [Chlamydomonas eustigma]|eukprot:GAX81943.1 hypothetical protein CEUSTIGMA_g9371.t1 [Chlamydomonas eustigma]